MPSSRPPFVAVIGGLWQLEGETLDRAKQAAREIGNELAKAGFGLVVYYSSDSSLEPHVVSGYVSASPAAGAITIRYSEGQRGQIRFHEEASHPAIFDHHLFPDQDWEAPFYRSLAEEDGVDAVLLLAGATSTLIAGHIAMARRLPIIAVDAFGGSAAKIWNQLAQKAPEDTHRGWGTRPASLFVEQLSSECAAVAQRRGEAEARRERLTRLEGRRHQTLYAALAFAVLLLTLFLGFVGAAQAGGYLLLMLVGLVAAGSTGALVRAVLAKGEESDPHVSLFLGAVAGFIVGLAYLIPQWVGAPGVLVAENIRVTASDKIQFASAVLVAISAGVGFDTIFSRMQAQAAAAAIAPPA